MRFFIRTLGCKLNQLDSARLAAALRDGGHEPAENEAQADWVLVNTCTVTAESERKSRQAVNVARQGQGQVVVLGCAPRAAPGRWPAGEVLVFPREADLLRHLGLDPGTSPFPLLERERLPVAIQYGCDDECSFCITRFARGPHRSEPADVVVARVREAEARGHREVVLTGVNVGAWGASDTRRATESRLAELLAELLARTGIARIRLSSLGPQYLGTEFFEVFADPRICDHLHLSAQSGADAVLARMRRGHDAARIHRVAEAARRVRPHVALTADLIAGFPGERQADLEQTLAMVEAVGFAKVHVFPFSPREGTAAAGLPGRPPPVELKARAARLRAAGLATRRSFLRAQIGRRAAALVERNGTGLTSNYVRLRVPGAAPGEIRQVQVTRQNLVDAG